MLGLFCIMVASTTGAAAAAIALLVVGDGVGDGGLVAFSERVMTGVSEGEAPEGGGEIMDGARSVSAFVTESRSGIKLLLSSSLSSALEMLAVKEEDEVENVKVGGGVLAENWLGTNAAPPPFLLLEAEDGIAVAETVVSTVVGAAAVLLAASGSGGSVADASATVAPSNLDPLLLLLSMLMF